MNAETSLDIDTLLEVSLAVLVQLSLAIAIDAPEEVG